MSSIILANNELAKLIKKMLETIEEVNQPDNVDGANVENFVVELEADKFLVLFEKGFEEKHIKGENITDYLDAGDGTFQDILEKIANKISEKIAIAASENKSVKLLQLLRARAAARRIPNNNFTNRRFAAGRAVMDNKNKGRRINFKIKLLLPQGRDVEVKHCGRVVRRMRVRRKAIVPATVRERRYPRN